MPQRRRLRTLSFGSEQAEADPLLDQAFYESRFYEGIESRTDHHRFLIGRTGSGKSALLKHLEDAHPDHVIRIDPENLALNYLHDLGIVKELVAREVHLDAFFNALWKHVLVVEIIRHRYQLDSPDSKRQLLVTLRELVRRDPAKRQALDYLEEFAENFWCETDQRVREIIHQLEKRLSVGASIETPIGLPASIDAHGDYTRTQLDVDHMIETDRLQRIINDTQVPRLNTMISVLDEAILSSPHDFTYVVIDDLDRDWADDDLANGLIRCLFGAVLSLVKVRNLKVIVALRTNIFDYLNFGPRGGGQEEKYRDLAFTLRWQDWELVAFADERAAVIGADQGIPTVRALKDMMPASMSSKRSATDFILSRTLMRPRDLISYLNLALEMAGGKTRLSWNDIYKAEAGYSEARLKALRDEWKPTFPGIDRLFELFRGAPVAVKPDEMERILTKVEGLLSDRAFPGEAWLFDLASPMWDHQVVNRWTKLHPLVELLYDIGFIGLGQNSQHLRFSYDEPGLANSARRVEDTQCFSVHPAFRITLDIASIQRAGRS